MSNSLFVSLSLSLSLSSLPLQQDKFYFIARVMLRQWIYKICKSAEVAPKTKEQKTGLVMDDMAIEWVEQVISFLPLTDVFKCRSVCKMWQAAANNVISDWEKLVLEVRSMRSPVRGKERAENTIFLFKSIIRRPGQYDLALCDNPAIQKEALAWIERLKQLARLKEIRFQTDYLWEFKALTDVLDDVMIRNARTLCTLRLDFQLLPLNQKPPVVFGNLRELECTLDRKGARLLTALCPRLVKLTTDISVKALGKITETLTSLHITYLHLRSTSHEEIGQLVAVVSRFTRLKDLSIYYGFDDHVQWTELHDQAFSKLFTNMKELEVVKIDFPKDVAVNVDAAIETLVRNSPFVRSITMHDSEMSDAGLHSLSLLTGLHQLEITTSTIYRLQNNVTTEGILSLLRGGSRNCLRDLKLGVAVSPDSVMIRAEADLIQQETGLTLVVSSQKGWSSFGIKVADDDDISEDDFSDGASSDEDSSDDDI